MFFPTSSEMEICGLLKTNSECENINPLNHENGRNFFSRFLQRTRLLDQKSALYLITAGRFINKFLLNK